MEAINVAFSWDEALEEIERLVKKEKNTIRPILESLFNYNEFVIYLQKILTQSPFFTKEIEKFLYLLSYDLIRLALVWVQIKNCEMRNINNRLFWTTTLLTRIKSYNFWLKFDILDFLLKVPPVIRQNMITYVLKIDEKLLSRQILIFFNLFFDDFKTKPYIFQDFIQDTGLFSIIPPEINDNKLKINYVFEQILLKEFLAQFQKLKKKYPICNLGKNVILIQIF